MKHAILKTLYNHRNDYIAERSKGLPPNYDNQLSHTINAIDKIIKEVKDG